MIEVVLRNVTLAYPMLGGGYKKKLSRNTTASNPDGAGAIMRDEGKAGRSVVALSDISMHLRNGDRVGLVGRNGSGKSTLLKVVGGVYEPFVGELKVTGTIAALYNAALGIRREATGYRNIYLAGLMAGLSKAEIKEIVPKIAEFSELGEYLDMPVRTYSNGMAMRLRFACGTAFSPQILLMDEWLGAGDPVFQRKAQDRMTELLDQAGILMLASHNNNTIRRNCNKAVWLDRGVMRAFGNVDEVLAKLDAANETAHQKRIAPQPKAEESAASQEAVDLVETAAAK